MFVKTSLLVADNIKDTSLLLNMSICCTLRFQNVLKYKLLGITDEEQHYKFLPDGHFWAGMKGGGYLHGKLLQS